MPPHVPPHDTPPTPPQFADDDVKILSGVDEGAFAWLTLNYLLGRLGGSEQDTGARRSRPLLRAVRCAVPRAAAGHVPCLTGRLRRPGGPPSLPAVASIDLGGGSVQEAYAMTPAEAQAAPDKQYLTELHSGGRTYHVYVYRWGRGCGPGAVTTLWLCVAVPAALWLCAAVHGPRPPAPTRTPPTPPPPPPCSYLGYGLMAGRAAVLSEEAEGGHPCVPTGHTGTYEYAGKTMSMKPHPVRV